VAKARSSGQRVAIVVAAVLVVALAGSFLYARFGQKPDLHPAGEAHRVVRVQVLNGSGEGGIGSRVASFLRDGGFHVVEVRNADRSDYFATMVVARREDPASAEAVARYLGGPPVVRQAWDSDLAEVTVVIGSDRSRLHLEP